MPGVARRTGAVRGRSVGRGGGVLLGGRVPRGAVPVGSRPGAGWGVLLAGGLPEPALRVGAVRDVAGGFLPSGLVAVGLVAAGLVLPGERPDAWGADGGWERVGRPDGAVRGG
ncbi:hypothetical protein GCM10010495_29700 [Kitasatospora herbaricolor]|nr:hypothetical protein GCM10010495_29700 [Kitasatospora herbaricolor]